MSIFLEEEKDLEAIRNTKAYADNTKLEGTTLIRDRVEWESKLNSIEHEENSREWRRKNIPIIILVVLILVGISAALGGCIACSHYIGLF